jgi:hypothetical protein
MPHAFTARRIVAVMRIDQWLGIKPIYAQWAGTPAHELAGFSTNSKIQTISKI